MRWVLFKEVLVMSWETLRGNKMRSALTILGIVIGITSIVGITSLLRGFDESFKDTMKTIGPDTIFVTKMSVVSFSSGISRTELLKRPNITVGARTGSILCAASTYCCAAPPMRDAETNDDRISARGT